MHTLRLSIIIPAYNEQETIQVILKKIGSGKTEDLSNTTTLADSDVVNELISEVKV